MQVLEIEVWIVEFLKVEDSKVEWRKMKEVSTFKVLNQLDIILTSSQTAILELTRPRYWRYINSV